MLGEEVARFRGRGEARSRGAVGAISRALEARGRCSIRLVSPRKRAERLPPTGRGIFARANGLIGSSAGKGNPKERNRHGSRGVGPGSGPRREAAGSARLCGEAGASRGLLPRRSRLEEDRRGPPGRMPSPRIARGAGSAGSFSPIGTRSGCGRRGSGWSSRCVGLQLLLFPPEAGRPSASRGFPTARGRRSDGRAVGSGT